MSWTEFVTILWSSGFSNNSFDNDISFKRLTFNYSVYSSKNFSFKCNRILKKNVTVVIKFINNFTWIYSEIEFYPRMSLPFCDSKEITGVYLLKSISPPFIEAPTIGVPS